MSRIAQVVMFLVFMKGGRHVCTRQQELCMCLSADGTNAHITIFPHRSHEMRIAPNRCVIMITE